MNPEIAAFLMRHSTLLLVVLLVLVDTCYFRRDDDRLKLRPREIAGYLRAVGPSLLKRNFKLVAFLTASNLILSALQGEQAAKVVTSALVVARDFTLMTFVFLAINLVASLIAGWLFLPAIAGAPGWRLRQGAVWLFSRRTVVEVFEPVLSDMQVEFFDALANGCPYKARWAQFKGYWYFWSHVFLQIPVDVSRIVVMLWRIGR